MKEQSITVDEIIKEAIKKAPPIDETREDLKEKPEDKLKRNQI